VLVVAELVMFLKSNGPTLEYGRLTVSSSALFSEVSVGRSKVVFSLE
jgi:hypothetical protein